MKIYLDNNLGVEKVEQEELTQDTIGYNILKVYIPNAVLTPYDTFTCYYGALLQNGRKVGWFAMEARTSSDADYEANYTLYKATLEQCVVSVEGKVYIGCQVLLGNSGNATLIKKNTAVVQFNVRKSVAINNDILILDTDQTTTDVLESYKQLLENALLTYATKATTYTKTEVDGKLDLKADKSDTYTKQEINEVAVGIMNDVDNLRGQVGDLSDTTTQLETDLENLKSVQNVVDIVPTYSALQYYDTTKLDVNDKVQVIADETHDGASTIYNWNGSAWQYVGAYGTNSYTKNEVYTKNVIDDKLDLKMEKQNPTGTGNISMNDGTASGNWSYANGDGATASGMFSKAVGFGAIARGSYAVTYAGSATANYAFAFGMMTEASAPHSRALGAGTKAKGEGQTVTGKFNIADTDSLEIVGNGQYQNPNNARLLDSNGNEYLRGDLFIDSTFTSSDGDLTSKTGTSVKNALSQKADKSDTYTRAVIDSMILTLSTDKADKSDVYTKTEIDGKFEEVGQMFEVVGNEVLKKADKTELDNAIKDLRWELGSHTLDVESDTTTAYSKSVPSGAIGCQINKIGGMSYKSENLIALQDVAETTINGLTYKVENGEISVSGTTTSGINLWVDLKTTLAENTAYVINFFHTGTHEGNVIYNVARRRSDWTNRVYATENPSFAFNVAYTIKAICLQFDNGGTYNCTFKPMAITGTTSPTTYKPYGILDSAITQIRSKNGSTIVDSLSIPTNVLDLTGYGWGIDDTCYNYIDFERKVFVQKVGCVVLNGTESGWEDRPNYTYADRFVLNAPGLLSPSEKGIVNWAGFEYIVTAPTTYPYVSNYNGHIMVNFSAKGTTTLAQFKEYLGTNNLIVYYELATPIETDISAYLTTDTIDVEGGGSLEFTNTYNQDVPSDIDYLIEEVKA